MCPYVQRSTFTRYTFIDSNSHLTNKQQGHCSLEKVKCTAYVVHVMHRLDLTKPHMFELLIPHGFHKISILNSEFYHEYKELFVVTFVVGFIFSVKVI